MLFGLIFIITITACGSRNDSSEKSFTIKDQAVELVEQSQIDCPGGDCPSFVGGFYFLQNDVVDNNRYNTGSCSHTLVGSDLILTNGHCVPGDLRFAGANCAKRIKFNFPKTNQYPMEKFDCKEVVAISVDPYETDHNKKPDWAILKMDRSSQRPPVSADTRGVSNNKLVSMYKVKFDLYVDRPNRGEIQRTLCKANTSNAYAYDHKGPTSPMMNVADCNHELMRGNSGAAILNAEAEESMLGIFSFYNDKSPGRTVGGGTNAVCIPIQGHNPPSQCHNGLF